MGYGIFMRSGGGSGSEDCSATRAEVLKGKYAITRDSDEEAVEGTLELTGDAVRGDVLNGKLFYNTNAKQFLEGSMPNNGKYDYTLSAGGEIVIPSGYHNGNGIITERPLSDEMSCTADASKILKGYTAWVNGSKVTGTMGPTNIGSIWRSSYSSDYVVVAWTNPSSGPYTGVVICRKTGGYPTSPNDNQAYVGVGSNAGAGATSTVTLSGLGSSTTYYIRAWSYILCDGVYIFGDSRDTTASTCSNCCVGNCCVGNCCNSDCSQCSNQCGPAVGC